MICKICNNSVVPIFKTIILNKYNVEYYQCNNCQFIQTEEPFWLKEAYESAITKLDIGLVSRNVHFSNVIEDWLLREVFNPNGIFLDYAGGYGLFVRLMRDKGFDFYREDLYCENLFADYFDLIDKPFNQKFDVITAFEVFEHLENPIDGLKKMLAYSDTIIFSTELQPSINLNPIAWWYFVPQTGQHISLFSYASLQRLASLENLTLYSNMKNMHILSRKQLPFNPFEKTKESLIFRLIQRTVRMITSQKVVRKRESLLSKDFDYIKSIL